MPDLKETLHFLLEDFYKYKTNVIMLAKFFYRQFKDLMAVATSISYKLKSIQDVKASLSIFSASPMLTICLVYGKQYLFFHSPLPIILCLTLE